MLGLPIKSDESSYAYKSTRKENEYTKGDKTSRLVPTIEDLQARRLTKQLPLLQSAE